MKECYAYVRVSTVRQGEKGTSLSEQRDAITAFAARHDMKILEWFEERETAAKQGRHEFSRIMKLVARRRDRGVIFHKIDRGARNLKDWSDIQELIEHGIDVYFAHESLDMTTRGGRLTADLLAVIASDYIRNLRDEVKKGMRGRLKQGLYPLKAPLGYLDQGGGRPKIPDPERGPLIRQAFEFYATGNYSLHTLADEMHRRGLRSWRNTAVGVTRLAKILRRSFYVGLIEIKGEIHAGIHEPLVSKEIFDRVQYVLDGKLYARSIRHDFTYKRMVRCADCGYHLIGERQKGRVYYRCHTKGCPTTSIRESDIETVIGDALAKVSFTKGEAAELMMIAGRNREETANAIEAARRGRVLLLQQNRHRLSRLTDAFLDGEIDQSLFQDKKRELLDEELQLREELEQANSDTRHGRLVDFLELATGLQQSYMLAETQEKREIVKSTTSNLTLSRKNLEIALQSPYAEVANCHAFRLSEPTRYEPRTFMKILEIIDE